MLSKITFALMGVEFIGSRCYDSYAIADVAMSND